jgi:hypothetical protein
MARGLPSHSGFSSSFPELSAADFEEYVRLESEAYGDITPDRFEESNVVGLQTQDFVRQYAPNPHQVLEQIQISGSGVDWSRELGACRFLRTSHLNDDLHEFLRAVGYPPEAVSFVQSHEKVLPGKGRTADQRWEAYYTPKLKQVIRQQDRALFELFPEFDV